jgi:hypothetical protein
MTMPLLYRILAASGSTHFSSPPFRAGHSNASFRELITKSSVEQATFAVNRRTRDKLYNLPDRMAGMLAAEMDQQTIHAMLTKEIYQIMEELSCA